MMKIDYTSNKPQTMTVPLMKSEDILGLLSVEYTVLDVDVNADSLIKEQVSILDELVTIASMTGNKISEIQRVWKGMVAKVGNVKLGVVLFKNVFALAPNMQDYFTAHHFEDGKMLDSDNVFKAHSVKLINAVTDSIELLDQPDKLKKVLKELGALHEQKRIPTSAFPIFGNALNATIQANLGKECSIEIINFFSLF